MQTIVTTELTLEPLRTTSHAEEMFEVLGEEAIYRYLDYSRHRLSSICAASTRGWKRAGHPMEARRG